MTNQPHEGDVEMNEKRERTIRHPSIYSSFQLASQRCPLVALGWRTPPVWCSQELREFALDNLFYPPATSHLGHPSIKYEEIHTANFVPVFKFVAPNLVQNCVSLSSREEKRVASTTTSRGRYLGFCEDGEEESGEGWRRCNASCEGLYLFRANGIVCKRECGLHDLSLPLCS